MQELLEKIRDAVYNGEDDEVKGLVEQAIEAGNSPEDIISKGGVPALDQLGVEFNNLEAFLPELMLAGDAMKVLIDVVTPHMKGGSSAVKGKVVIGCAKGDLHDIGKSLVATQLSVHGFSVLDIGVDVPSSKFIETACAEQADIIAISSLLTTSQYYMEDLIKRLQSEGKREKFYVVVGGGPVTPEYAARIGADGYSRTAALAVEMANEILTSGKGPGEGLICKE